MNLKESNNEVAVFMNLKVGIYPSADGKGYWETPIGDVSRAHADRLLYHSDWKWLMPVVDKIETIKGNGRHNFVVEIASTFCFVYAKPKTENLFVNMVGDTKLQAVYNACVKFIKFYNEKKQDEQEK